MVNKKASILDLLFIAVALLFFAMVTLIGFKIQSEFNTFIQASPDMPADAKTASTTLTGHYTGAMDASTLFLLAVLVVGTLTLAALIRVHPIFIPLYIIALTFIIFYCAILSNIYQEMASNSGLIAQANQMVIMTNVLTYLPIIIGVIGTILGILMFKTWQNAD